MSVLIFAWIASIAYGVYSLTAKLIGKYKIKNTYQFSFFTTFFSGIIIAVISYFNGGRLAANWSYIFLSAALLAVGTVFYLSSVKALDVSVLAPLYNIRVVITVIFGILLLGEELSNRSVILIAIIIGAGFFATMDERFSIKSFFCKNVALGLFYMLLLSIRTISINRAIDKTDYWTAMLWIGLLSIPFSFAIFYPKFRHEIKNTKSRDYFGVLILALIGGLGDLAAYKAFETNVGLSSVIISLPVSSLLVLILGFWKPGLLEKHTVKVYAVRITATIIMILGALQLR
jgi:drug/metabolite transporter (DMT)-like permease